MKLPKLRELAEAVKALSHSAYTSKFPFEPHEPYPSFRGQPKYDDEKCLGCLACEAVCPAEAIGHEDIVDGEIPIRKMIHYTDTCIAPEQTTEEFLAGLETERNFPGDYKTLLRTFLKHCDLVKFAEHHPETEDIQNTFNSCKAFIEGTAIKNSD